MGERGEVYGCGGGLGGGGDEGMAVDVEEGEALHLGGLDGDEAVCGVGVDGDGCSRGSGDGEGSGGDADGVVGGATEAGAADGVGGRSVGRCGDGCGGVASVPNIIGGACGGENYGLAWQGCGVAADDSHIGGRKDGEA